MGGALGHCQARRYDPAHGAERDGRMPVAAPLGLPTIVMAGGQILTLEFVPWHTLGHKLGESGVTVSLDSRCGNPVEQAFGVRVAGQALGPADQPAIAVPGQLQLEQTDRAEGRGDRQPSRGGCAASRPAGRLGPPALSARTDPCTFTSHRNIGAPSASTSLPPPSAGRRAGPGFSIPGRAGPRSADWPAVMVMNSPVH